MKVGEQKLMTPVTCKGDTSVTEIAQLTRKFGARHVIVVDGETPIGLISIIDIMNKVIAEKKDPAETKAVEIMNAPLETVDESEDITKAYVRMIQKNRFSMPVTRGGKLVGVLPFTNMKKE